MIGSGWSSPSADASRRGRTILRLVSKHGHEAPRRILDVGCAEGGVAAGLAEQGAFVVGMELALHLLRRAAARPADERRQVVRFIAGDATAFPFDDASFDLVVLYDVLEHVTRWPVIVAETSRVLRSGGLAFVTAANPRSPITMLDDPHWRLPLVALLPPAPSSWLVRVSRRGELDMAGDFPRFPSGSDMRRVFARSGFQVQVVSNLHKLLNPDSVVSPSRRAIAGSTTGRWLLKCLTSRVGAPVLRAYDRSFARSWTFLLQKQY